MTTLLNFPFLLLRWQIPLLFIIRPTVLASLTTASVFFLSALTTLYSSYSLPRRRHPFLPILANYSFICDHITQIRSFLFFQVLYYISNSRFLRTVCSLSVQHTFNIRQLIHISKSKLIKAAHSYINFYPVEQRRSQPTSHIKCIIIGDILHERYTCHLYFVFNFLVWVPFFIYVVPLPFCSLFCHAVVILSPSNVCKWTSVYSLIYRLSKLK